MDAEIVILARHSLELELALDALEELRPRLRVHPSPAEMSDWLRRRDPRSASTITVILIEVDACGRTEVGSIVAELRRAPDTALVPIVFWGGVELGNSDECRPNSFVPRLADASESADVLARALHYWGVINRSPVPELAASGQGLST